MSEALAPAARGRPAAWQLAVIAAHAVAVACLASRHEPWFDEAQAWLIARDGAPLEIVAHQLRYEGNPGLWHALLAPLARAGAPYASMRVLAASLAVAGAALFVLRAPFPAWVRAAFPFTYYPLYQYAVVARPYALALLGFFALAACWPQRLARPFATCGLLGALALVSVHGWLIAAALGALQAGAVWAARAELPRALVRRHSLALAGLATLGAFVAIVLWPPRDHALVVPGFQLHPDAGLGVAWRYASASLTEIAPLSLAAYALSAALLRSRRALVTFFAPAALLVAFAATKAYSEWHEGMLFLLWMFALWVGFAALRPATEPRWLAPAALGALGLVLGVQASWSLATARYDWSHAYSGAPAAARWLVETTSPRDTIYATGFGSFALQPYFSRNRFDNYRARSGPAYFDSRVTAPLVTDYAAILRARPDVVIVGVKASEDEAIARAPERWFPGYSPRVFRGALFWKNRVLEDDSYVVYRRDAPSAR